jgi:predicted metalloendopeptidase
VSLVDEDIIIVNELDVLRNISTIINGESPRVIQNYLIWRFMMSQIDYMPQRFRSIQQQFNRIFQGVKTEKARTIKCVTYVMRYMGFAVSRLYIMKYFDRNSRKEVKNKFIAAQSFSSKKFFVMIRRIVDRKFVTSFPRNIYGRDGPTKFLESGMGESR